MDGCATLVEGAVTACDKEANAKKRREWRCPWPVKKYILASTTTFALVLFAGYIVGQTLTLIASHRSPKITEGLRLDERLDFPTLTICVHNDERHRMAVANPRCIWGSFGLGGLMGANGDDLMDCSIERGVILPDSAAQSNLACVRFNGANLTSRGGAREYNAPHTEGKRNLTTMAVAFATPTVLGDSILPALVYLSSRDDARNSRLGEVTPSFVLPLSTSVVDIGRCNHFFGLLAATQKTFAMQDLTIDRALGIDTDNDRRAQWSYGATLTGGVEGASKKLGGDCPNVLELAFGSSAVTTLDEHVDFTWLMWAGDVGGAAAILKSLGAILVIIMDAACLARCCSRRPFAKQQFAMRDSAADDALARPLFDGLNGGHITEMRSGSLNSSPE